MTVMLDAFLIINAFPPKFLQKRFPYFFHGAFAPSFIWSRRPCVFELIRCDRLSGVEFSLT